jgi:hypothetical protein
MAKWQLYKSKPTHFDESGIGSRLTLLASIGLDVVEMMQRNDNLLAPPAGA